MNEFEAIYQQGGWDGQGSGPGSTEEFTRGFRKVFKTLLVEKRIQSVFDLGCGDWQWMRHVKWPPGIDYTGWDASESACKIAQLKAFDTCYDSITPRSCFIENIDAFDQPIWPEADLLLVKDVLHHVSRWRARMLIDRAKLYDYVLWVVDLDGDYLEPINWQGPFPRWTEIYRFDTSPPYRYGPKVALLQLGA